MLELYCLWLVESLSAGVENEGTSNMDPPLDATGRASGKLILENSRDHVSQKCHYFLPCGILHPVISPDDIQKKGGKKHNKCTICFRCSLHCYLQLLKQGNSQTGGSKTWNHRHEESLTGAKRTQCRCRGTWDHRV